MVNDNRSRSLYVPLSEAVPPSQRVGRKEELKLILERDMTKLSTMGLRGEVHEESNLSRHAKTQ